MHFERVSACNFYFYEFFHDEIMYWPDYSFYNIGSVRYVSIVYYFVRIGYHEKKRKQAIVRLCQKMINFIGEPGS